MSYEKNCAVAEKLGYYALLHENMDAKELAFLKRHHGEDSVYVQETDNDSFYGKNYCNNPNDIMPIIFANHISICANAWFKGPADSDEIEFSGTWNACHEKQRIDVNNKDPLIAGVDVFLKMKI